MHKKRIVILVKFFSLDQKNKWLTDDLAYELINKGNIVDIIFFSFKTRGNFHHEKLNNNLNLYIFPLRYKKNISFYRFLKASFRARRIIAKTQYDLLINFSIASVFLIPIISLKSVKHKLLILWDFFPIHQIEIKKFRSQSFTKIMYAAENLCIKMHNSIGLMSPKNVAFFEKYHPNFTGNKHIIPLWKEIIDMENINCSANIKIEKPEPFKIIFGGQLSKGRGLDFLLESIKKNEAQLKHINFIIAGDGELLPLLIEESNRLKIRNIKFTGKLCREEYLSLLCQCDAGLIITVPNVSIPSFPSKSLDYLLCEKPVIAITEDTTDFGKYIEDNKCGMSATFNEPEKIVYNFKKISQDKKYYKKLKENTLPTLEKNHDVKKIAPKILEVI